VFERSQLRATADSGALPGSGPIAQPAVACLSGGRALPIVVIVQDPWVGPLYRDEGIRGQRLAVVGYPSWTPHDSRPFSVDFVRNVVDGVESRAHFFNAIPGYFGMDRADFYRHVVFFEFVPCAIGGPEDRYKWATPEQVAVARDRAFAIAQDYAVEKLVFFSSKAWRSMPPTVERAAGSLTRLPKTNFEFGHYQLDRQQVIGVGLRHPQYAPSALMRRAVEEVLFL
jgi:hypothetical protein